MSLAQSMAVIFGANVGTTVTAWIISAFSFEVSISDYSILLLAVGVPMLFMKKSTYKSFGEFLIGFCFLFMGLDLISKYVPDLKANPEMLSFVTNYTTLGYGSVLIFFFIGIILTMVAQRLGSHIRYNPYNVFSGMDIILSRMRDNPWRQYRYDHHSYPCVTQR